MYQILSEVLIIESIIGEINARPLFFTKVDLSIEFEGRVIRFNKPVYRNGNRYFLPFNEFTKHLHGKVKKFDQKIYLVAKNKTIAKIDARNMDYKFTICNGEFYLSIIDVCMLLNIISRWDYENQTIELFWNREKQCIPHCISKGRIALIRLEDITAGNEYIESSSLEKLRIIGDYMYCSGIPFHIAWIPKFVNPISNIENDISKDYNMPNAHFLFTMEYLLCRSGVIGLHGYTHQYGNELSGVGTEFSEERNNDELSIRKRIEAAINIANRVELPIKFFESPHYASTAFQQSIYEQYFNIIYEGYVGIWGENIVVSPRNGRTLYVPTPLGYVEGTNGLELMLNRINSLNEDSLASLFYHPYIEFEYIYINTEDNGYPQYNYSVNSPLHKISKALYQKGCRFTKVTELSRNLRKS